MTCEWTPLKQLKSENILLAKRVERLEKLTGKLQLQITRERIRNNRLEVQIRACNRELGRAGA